ncbi:iron (metal) dependent repressor, DtxR family [Halopelagius inordinatus]|uniref:Iron (Metal) dependent repressor, DtxR family n=1 Tax=Halopelagius inordinatus TaxID=553467 RepID=A0A1I2RL90_9EURY|nr:metal-dependent transcriptional regulator [Halopelagius inordinatus]SFG41282.1 iron (metal) dependent repressor, DtxR family [Halopelagius inordinatus]
MAPAQYLLAVRRLRADETTPVPTGAIAAELDRSPAAATEMADRLAERGLVEHEPYEGVVLTEEGDERADRLARTYEILCRFCRDVLCIDDYEAEASALVGTVSADVAERLAEVLLTDEKAPSP